ncbi:MAG: S66 peptidase family protein [Flavobacteriales bacterium]
MRPLILKPNDKVIVLSPSGRVNEEQVRENSKLLESWGLKVEFGYHTFDIHNKMAGKDADRLSDLQNALDNPEIKAIFCSRGGYGLVRIIDRLDFSKFLINPKWIIGFSDVTVLHNQLNNLGVASVHAPMVNSYHSTPQVALGSLKSALFDKEYQLETPFQNNEIVGGNLAIIYSLLGTDSDINTDNKVLLIEEIGEYAYNIDRMIHGLKKAGKFNNLKGLLVGQFSGTKDDEFGYSVKEIIENCTQEYDFPIQYNIPVGHVDDNRAVVLGI